jgi:S1-C subfamily serine protease
LAIALPLVVGNQLVGTCFVAGQQDNQFALVTVLHLLGSGKSFQVGIPPHGGDLSQPQPYPISQIPTLKAKLALAEPFLDLAVLTFDNPKMSAPIPRFVNNTIEIKTGDEVIVVGYPFSPIGSCLETATITRVSAIGKRIGPANCGRFELILPITAHPGSSGSPVVRRSDGFVCGVIRGCLAPPSVISAGNLPLGTDTSVTYATGVDQLPNLIKYAFQMSEVL